MAVHLTKKKEDCHDHPRQNRPLVRQAEVLYLSPCRSIISEKPLFTQGLLISLTKKEDNRKLSSLHNPVKQATVPSLFHRSPLAVHKTQAYTALMLTTLAPQPPLGFLTTRKPLPQAQHIFGTKTDNPSTDHAIRSYTERLGPIAHMRQVHGNRVAYVTTSGITEEADAVYTDQDNLWLAVKTADCAPVLISSPVAVAAVHAGWRGLENGILAATIEAMCDDFSLTPDDLHVALGPCIHQHNYEVDGTFEARFNTRFLMPSATEGHFKLDIPALVRHQVIKAGVLDIHFHDINRCTYTDEASFHSYRRSTHQGLAKAPGQQLSLIRRLST